MKSVQSVLHVFAPALERWKATDVIPAPLPSAALAVRTTVLARNRPGSFSVPVGAVLSTRRFVYVVDAVVLPALSAASERRS